MSIKNKIGYAFQAGGAIAGSVGLYMTLSHKAIFGTLVGAAFAWFVGWFIRRKL